MQRTAHYVISTHWDREWYDTFQGFRMRLVSMLDEVLETLDRDPEFKAFVMDGQAVAIEDYLEIRPENREKITGYIKSKRIMVGPWYVLPDEWLVSGESLVRNIQAGQRLAQSYGAEASRAGFACDMFGHVGQLPQIMSQLGITGALIWRGTNEREHSGLLNWKAPDETVLPAYRFGKIGYCSLAIAVRGARDPKDFSDVETMAGRMVEFTLEQAKRTPWGPIMLFDGGDHLEIEPEMSKVIALANKALEAKNIRIVHSDLDRYLDELAVNKAAIGKTVVGELRETGREPGEEDEQWLIPGVLSSRIRLKQQNAACEDELCLWAEPFSAFAAVLGNEYPEGFLRTSWKHLLENHPHDSICGCSLDQIHKDMLYRFDNSIDISSRLTQSALKSITAAAAPENLPEGAFLMAVFNPAAADVDEPVDIDIPLPSNWPVFREFFGFEDKFSFILESPEGESIPYQLVAQERNRKGYSRLRRKFPIEENRHVVTVTARVKIPALGYTTFVVKPVEGPVRNLGSMMTGNAVIENERFRVTAAANGNISIYDKVSKRSFEDQLLFEERADIGDGWYHGLAVNDMIYTSTASAADIAVVTDGINKATLRIAVTMNVPREFDFSAMKRSSGTVPLKIVSDVTLRKGCERIEVATRIENNALDHRVRVLFPTGIEGAGYLSDSVYDVVERPVALLEDNEIRKELDVETRPQISWTAFGDSERGLAIVSRGLPESAVLDREDRALALTLFRGFRRAVMDNDNPGGQEPGTLDFRFWIVPYIGETPLCELFRCGQRVMSPSREVMLTADEIERLRGDVPLPQAHSFLSLDGRAVLTSVQREDRGLLVRLFNPRPVTAKITLILAETFESAHTVTLDGRDDMQSTVVSAGDGVIELMIPPKRIATVLVK